LFADEHGAVHLVGRESTKDGGFFDVMSRDLGKSWGPAKPVPQDVGTGRSAIPEDNSDLVDALKTSFPLAAHHAGAANNRYLVLILASMQKETGDRRVPPLNIWKIPLREGRPDFNKAIMYAQLTRIYNCDDHLTTCLHDEKLYCAYTTMWDSGADFILTVIPLNDEKSTTDLRPRKLDDRGCTSVVGPPKSFKVSFHADIDEGRRIWQPTPIAFFVDGKNVVHFIGREEKPKVQLFEIQSSDQGKTWTPARLVDTKVLVQQPQEQEK
jgi:hypothetical protein